MSNAEPGAFMRTLNLQTRAAYLNLDIDLDCVLLTYEDLCHRTRAVKCDPQTPPFLKDDKTATQVNPRRVATKTPGSCPQDEDALPRRCLIPESTAQDVDGVGGALTDMMSKYITFQCDRS
ncbi:hypothetical protein Bbelb_086140 [Branchiostoma belcheri]|nr:hypothetical protein Bbelb_086140 [Branchiostoma belcheri]